MALKFLIDTNVFISLEPTSSSDLEDITEATVRLARHAMSFRHQLYIHPSARSDIARDTNKDRSELRHILLEKYPVLPDPPEVSHQLEAIIGTPLIGTNDWVDNQLIAALNANAVDFLITEDRKLQKKAFRLGLGKRVTSVTEAISLILDLSERIPPPPPAVLAVKAYALSPSDPIFNSFREDYPKFDKWFQKIRLEHRQTWIIKGNQDSLAALCIINPENNPPPFLSGKTLKLCSFKVSERYNGFRYGELMLKAVFEYASKNQYDWIYVTVFEKHSKLIQIFEDFGFKKLHERTALGEIILAKPHSPLIKDAEIQNSLEYHIRYGPYLFRIDNLSWYVVPIQPRYAQILFPECEGQRALFPGLHPSGNAIRKAYLCNSPIRSIMPGSVLLFYRSESYRGSIALGVVEETVITSSSEEIVRVVGKRTVYTLEQIEELCKSPVLTILFRQARIFHPAIPLKDLTTGKVFIRSPQSISSLKEEGIKWLQTKLAK